MTEQSPEIEGRGTLDRETLAQMSPEELQKLYKERVGISERGYTQEELIEAIIDPATERERIRAIDLEEDRADRNPRR